MTRSKSILRRFLSVALATAMSVSLLACGGDESASNGTENNGNDTNNTGYVYVPEFIGLGDTEESSWRSSVSLSEDKMYYTMYNYDEVTGESTTKLYTRDVADPANEVPVEVPLPETKEGYNTSMDNFFFDEEGNLYVLYYVYPVYIADQDYDYNDYAYTLIKYDSSMNQVFSVNLMDIFTDENNTYISRMVAGKDGKLFAASSDIVYVLGADGTLQASIPTQSDRINDMFVTTDGRVFIMRYNNVNYDMEMVEIDAEKNALGTTYTNLPDMNAQAKGYTEGKVLIIGSSNLYEYNLETQESSVIVNWVDCNITGDYVQDAVMLENGDILVYYDDYENNEELVKLVKTDASKVQAKEIITFATLYSGDQSLEQAVVKFNKSSDKYQIKLKYYIDNNAEWTDTTYSDGIALLNADLTSTNCPDLIDLSSVDLNNLASKGVLEDLTPYLENSSVLSKEDFQASVLDAYTFDGRLVTIPRMFQLSTLMAKTSLVGEKQGCTIDDIIALADAHPEAALMNYMTPAYALRICLRYNSDSFIDYETGACSFDSPEFIKVLEFASRFETDYDNEESYPSMIQSGKILLSDVSVSDTQEFQMYTAMFEEPATCIGYPTMDGSVGVFLNGMDMYGMTAKSEHKDGAWAFLESYLSYNSNDRYSWGLPTRTDELDEMFAEDMTPNYIYDENGEIMKDENGELMQEAKTSWGYDDWEVEIYAATQEQVDMIKELISVAKPAGMNDENIFEMINEEAAAYFEGQKSAEDVAKIIQSRVEIYISENS